jgi:hypothetical protein
MRLMNANIYNIFRYQSYSFNIIEKFAALSAKRKMFLCDLLFSEGSEALRKTAGRLWPQATPQDLQKLERFLLLIKKK